MATERVAILHQGCVPVYRKPFFELLARQSKREYVVFHGDPDPASGVTAAPLPYGFPNRRVSNYFVRIFGRSFAFQSALFPVAFGGYDALVIGHEIKYVTSLLLILWFRLRGKPVILWGHGYTRDLEGLGGSRAQKRMSLIVEWIKARMIRGAAGYMAYSTTGARYVASVGMPNARIAVLRNTIDMSDEIAAHSKWREIDRGQIRDRLGVARDAIVYTFLGRLLALKRAELLPKVANALRSEHLPIEVMIVGGGADEAKLKSEYGNASWFHLLGSIFERDRIAEILAMTDAVVIPDYIGLAINHGFAHGLPVITMSSSIHGPEIDYLDSGVNGLIVDGEKGLRDALGDFARDPALRQKLSAGALQSRGQFDLSEMVKAFDDAVATALT